MSEQSRSVSRQTVSGIPPAKQQSAELVTGSVWSEDLGRAGSPAVMVNRSHFEPGARTCWHIHPGGQTLVVESGIALVQEDGGPVLAVSAGSSVMCPPGVRHWHGASPQHTMTQLAITPSDTDGRYADWGALVTDEEYAGWDGTVPRASERGYTVDLSSGDHGAAIS